MEPRTPLSHPPLAILRRRYSGGHDSSPVLLDCSCWGRCSSLFSRRVTNRISKSCCAADALTPLLPPNRPVRWISPILILLRKNSILKSNFCATKICLNKLRKWQDLLPREHQTRS